MKTQVSGIMHPMGSIVPAQTIIPSGQSMGEPIGGQGTGQDAPSGIQKSGIMQPIWSMSPGHRMAPGAHSYIFIYSIGGQWSGHSSPSVTQLSGILQPMGSMGPQQFLIPSPQSIGSIGGHGAGTARAVERRAKKRRNILMLTLLLGLP